MGVQQDRRYALRSPAWTRTEVVKKLLGILKAVSLTQIILIVMAVLLLMNWQEQRKINGTLDDLGHSVFAVHDAICSLAGTNCNGITADE